MSDISIQHIKVIKMNISSEYYKAFYYVAKHGSVSKAAKLLYSNQPNLTRTIKNLESQLGCPLFLRTNRGMKLTFEGRKLYSHIKIAFEQIEAAEIEITESLNLESGTVFIAASEVALRCLLLPILKEYRELYPKIHIRISNYSTPQAISALKDGIADFAVVTEPTVKSPLLTEINVKKVAEAAICSPDIPLPANKKIPLSEIKKYPLISLGSDTKSYEFYRSFFKSCGEEYSPDIEVFTADQILPVAQAGLGIGFVPREFIRQQDNVRIIDLKEKIPERSICLIKRTGQPLSAAAEALEHMILK